MEGAFLIGGRTMYKELEEHLIKARAGEMESKKILLEMLYPLIISTIKRYYNKEAEYEELLQEGRLVVLEAMESFDPNKEVHFLGYVKLMLKYYYLNKYKEKRFLSLNEKTGEDNEEEIIDLLVYEEDSALDKIIKSEGSNMLLDAIFSLPQSQRDIIIDFYLERLSIPEIAKKYNITYRSVVYTKGKAIEKLRERLITS